MKVAFVSGPYRSDTESGIVRNIREAEKVAIELWCMGYAVICPHKNTSLLGGLCDDSVWLEGDLELLKRSDCIVMTSGWQISEGSRIEHRHAKRGNIPIFYWYDKAELQDFSTSGKP